MAKLVKQPMLTVETWHADGTITKEKVPMNAAMQQSFGELRKAFEKHGCKCRKPHPKHIRIVPRGHSVDVICSDCNGVRQAG